jgi:hypothetical protein
MSWMSFQSTSLRVSRDKCQPLTTLLPPDSWAASIITDMFTSYKRCVSHNQCELWRLEGSGRVSCKIPSHLQNSVKACLFYFDLSLWNELCKDASRKWGKEERQKQISKTEWKKKDLKSKGRKQQKHRTKYLRKKSNAFTVIIYGPFNDAVNIAGYTGWFRRKCEYFVRR